MRKIARIVIRHWPRTNPQQAETVLHHSLLTLQEEVQFLITPGGFVFLPFSKWEGSSGWNTTPEDLQSLIAIAEPHIKQIISPRILQAAKNKVRYLTLSFDLRALNLAPHAELIALINLSSGEILNYTGKSYPTTDQEKSLIHVTDLASHLLEVGAPNEVPERVLILGCHDLNIFNPRARANQKIDGSRHQRCQAMLAMFEEFNPTIILHHPHATDTWKSWIQAWREIGWRFPRAAWASAIAYAHPHKTRAPLADVLARTHYEGGLSSNLIIAGRPNPTILQRKVCPNVLQI